MRTTAREERRSPVKKRTKRHLVWVTGEAKDGYQVLKEALSRLAWWQ